MNDTERLVRRYIAVWNERDGARRRQAIDTTFTADVRYTDPLADLSGIDEFDAVVVAVQAQFPELVFSFGGAVDAYHDTARFTWRLASPYGGEAPVVGFDVVHVNDGKIGRVYGFLDKVPAVAASAG
jgi:hypothetical protein